MIDPSMDYTLLADERLVNLLQTDNKAAFQEIYNRYWKLLYYTALKKVRINEVAEELIQGVFVSLWTKRNKVHIHKLPNYLNTAVKYRIINYIRLNITKEKYAQHSKHQYVAEENTSETVLLQHELSVAIDKAIHLLPEKTQRIFRLSRFENCTTKEIAQMMNLSEKTVEYHITQSLKMMRLHLKDFILVAIVLLKLYFLSA